MYYKIKSNCGISYTEWNIQKALDKMYGKEKLTVTTANHQSLFQDFINAQEPWYDVTKKFNEMFDKIWKDKPNKKGIRLQKTKGLCEFMGNKFTIIIKREDTL